MGLCHIRDAVMLRANAGRILHVCDAFHAETLACLKGARMASECGMGQVMIETDSTMWCRDNSDKPCYHLPNYYRLAALGGLIYELKQLNY